MHNVWIIDYIRTPIGKQGGALSQIRPDDLAAHVMKALIERNHLDPALIDEVFMGCANQAGEDSRNIARNALLLAGFPEHVPGVTINRNCASGLDAVIQACRAIALNEIELAIAGGVESMTRAPLVLPKPEQAYVRGNQILWDSALGWRMGHPNFPYPLESNGETAENVAGKYQISREEQDRFALESQRRAAKAQETGLLREEIVAVSYRDKKQNVVIVDKDEHIRPDTTLEKLASLKPLFRKGGSVTAGNSSGINDGAAALLVVSEKRGKELGLKPKARYIISASAGVSPRIMGIGPVPATKKALQLAGLTVADLDWIEINEAFAAQVLACMRELRLNPEKVNPNGGAIAIGHPLGCSGARLVGTLINQLQRTEKRYGLATLCVGVGQGVSAIFERVN
jgi:3-oxoadipyl-CoA thiolase